jgi:hypothetical protein
MPPEQLTRGGVAVSTTPVKVFVAYGFRESDRWVRDHVIPLIQA